MFYNCDLETIAKQAFADHLWQNENPDPSWIKGKILTQCRKTRNSLSMKQKKIREINSFFSSTIAFTEFLSKMCESKFP